MESRRYDHGFHLQRHERRGLAGGVRRRGVVRQPTPALVIDHLHRHLERSAGAWPIIGLLDERLGAEGAPICVGA